MTVELLIREPPISLPTAGDRSNSCPKSKVFEADSTTLAFSLSADDGVSIASG